MPGLWRERAAVFEVRGSGPYTAVEPMEGLLAYGAYSVPKRTICTGADFVHFAFADGEERIVRWREVKKVPF